MCFVFIWEQTATCATYSINWLVFITEMKSVYSAVRTGALNKTVFYSPLVTWCTTSLTFNNCTLCPHCIYVFCIYLRTNTDLCHLQHKLTCATYSINWLVFITEMKSVYSAVRTGSVNKAVCASSLKGLMVLDDAKARSFNGLHWHCEFLRKVS